MGGRAYKYFIKESGAGCVSGLPHKSSLGEKFTKNHTKNNFLFIVLQIKNIIEKEIKQYEEPKGISMYTDKPDIFYLK